MSDEVTTNDNSDKNSDVNTLLPDIDLSEQTKGNISEMSEKPKTVTEESITSTKTPFTSAEPIYCTPAPSTLSTTETSSAAEPKPWKSK